MSKPDKFHGSTAAIFAFACAVFVVAMTIAHGAAVLQQHLNPNPDPFYYLVIFTIWACISLLTPALCFHLFSRRNSPNNYWRAFWTFAYLALLVHLYWAITGSCGGSFEAIYKLENAQEAHPGCVVAHPTPDFSWRRGGGWTWFWRMSSPTASNGCACSAALFTCSPS